jgi:NAD(P)-dependent dehydrogenase (short-subunit alcohol dehydrogenase family)
MELPTSTALITGASRGLGRALALALGERGARVLLSARESPDLQRTARHLIERGARVHVLAADVADKQAIYPLVGQAGALAGPIDILINNASTLGPTPLPLLLDTECEDLERVLAVNLIGPFRLTKAVLGSMLLRDRGVIVNISSDASEQAYPSWGAYGASKAALDQLTRIWAQELGDTRVRMFAVDPGEMDTDMHAAAMPDVERSSLERPEVVAEKIVQMLEQPARAQNGARLIASQWRSS